MTETQRKNALAGLRASEFTRGKRGQSRLKLKIEKIQQWLKVDGKTQIEVVKLLEADGLKVSLRWLNKWLNTGMSDVKRRSHHRKVRSKDTDINDLAAEITVQVLRALRGQTPEATPPLKGRPPLSAVSHLTPSETQQRIDALRNKPFSRQTDKKFSFNQNQPLVP